VAVSFEKVRRVRTFDDIVEQLREAILSGRIRPGERLPGERQLCEELGVGRTTLREALRALEAVGMIQVRPGKSGGSFAATPSESTLGDALASLVSLRGASIEDLSEFRVDFEAENAAWAARRADATDITTLKELVDDAREAGGVELLAEIDVHWHEALARATKNRLRIGIALGIHGAVTRRHNMIVRPAALEQALTIPGDLAAVTAAVADGDAELARILMRDHISAWNRRSNG
jgi:DNA-binding FadR family transcriptional regulator